MNTPSGPLIGLIGVGTMGSRMGRRLADRDVRLILYDAAPGAAARLAGLPSVTIADDVAELAGCDAVITMIPSGDDVRLALLGGPSPLAGHQPVLRGQQLDAEQARAARAQPQLRRGLHDRADDQGPDDGA